MEAAEAPARAAVDSGLIGLVMLARFHGEAVEPDQLTHQYATGGPPFRTTEILRAARTLRLKAREVTSRIDRLAKTPLPALAELNDGSYLVLGRLLPIKSSCRPRLRRGPRY